MSMLADILCVFLSGPPLPCRGKASRYLFHSPVPETLFYRKKSPVNRIRCNISRFAFRHKISLCISIQKSISIVVRCGHNHTNCVSIHHPQMGGMVLGRLDGSSPNPTGSSTRASALRTVAPKTRALSHIPRQRTRT